MSIKKSIYIITRRKRSFGLSHGQDICFVETEAEAKKAIDLLKKSDNDYNFSFKHLKTYELFHEERVYRLQLKQTIQKLEQDVRKMKIDHNIIEHENKLHDLLNELHNNDWLDKAYT